MKLKHYFGAHNVVIIAYYPMKNILEKPNQFSRLSQIDIELSEYKINYKLLSIIKGYDLPNFIVE